MKVRLLLGGNNTSSSFSSAVCRLMFWVHVSALRRFKHALVASESNEKAANAEQERNGSDLNCGSGKKKEAITDMFPLKVE